MESPTNSKRCSACKQTLPVGEFWRLASSKDGLQALCKPCLLAAQRASDERKASSLKPESRKCPKCSRELALCRFAKNKRGPYGVCAYCKGCSAMLHRVRYEAGYRQKARVKDAHWRSVRHAWALRRNFDMSPAEYERLLAAQDGVCAICKCPPPDGTGRYHHLGVDHCHKCSVVRGLLCMRCNQGIGQAMDTPSTMRAGADYLEAHYK